MLTRLPSGRLRSNTWRLLLALLLGLLGGGARAQTAPAARPASDSANVVLVTIDGLRWQELFGGADPRLLRRHSRRRTLRPRYERPAAEDRRAALLPFLWDGLAPCGQVFGNRALGNCQDVANHRRVSYPGYNELLAGAPDDQRISGNRGIYNPNQTVLEYLNRQPGVAGRVAAFASWEAFPFILNQPRSGLLVDAGLNGRERPDSLTYQAARRYLLRARPRVLFIAFGNTDTQAHAGHYAEYLDAAHAIDGYLADLWATLQALPQYRGRTTLLITTDHGRGRGRLWSQHGRELPASGQTWLAAMGPGVPATGEARTPGQRYQGQVAGQLASCLGLDYPAPSTGGLTGVATVAVP